MPPRSIDVHTHFYPQAYVKDIQRGGAVARIESSGGELNIHYAGDYNVMAPGHLTRRHVTARPQRSKGGGT